jgi:hypothetical protein
MRATSSLSSCVLRTAIRMGKKSIITGTRGLHQARLIYYTRRTVDRDCIASNFFSSDAAHATRKGSKLAGNAFFS